MIQQKRTQDIGDTTYCRELPANPTQREKFLHKLAEKGCPAECSCTHIFDRTNKILGNNI